MSRYVTAIRAVLFAKRVSNEVYKERLNICAMCPFSRLDEKGSRYCDICGCGVTARKKIFNLAIYEENLPHYGCKHPSRRSGKGWPILKQQ